MNTLYCNHKFVFSDDTHILFIINGKVFLENRQGVLLDIRTLNPFKRSVSNHLFCAITHSLNPDIILNVLKKKTGSLKWKIVST